MRRMIYLIKIGIRISKIDSNGFLRAIQVNGIKEDCANAVMKEIITLDDYENICNVIQEEVDKIENL